jgi:anthranilate phosphoribosyltransferase
MNDETTTGISGKHVGQPSSELRDTADSTSPLRNFSLRLMQGKDLARHEAAEFLDALLNETATDSQIAAALIALAIKGATGEELAGMASVMRSRAVRIRSNHSCFVDTAGTGSSRMKTFNISTAAAFVIAGAGLPVAKHGGRAATSRSGSADVLTALGVKVSAAPEVSERCLNELGICFMFAPLYHGATARVATVRRELAIPTTFNLLGPLTNPAGAPRQIVGVWHPFLVEPLAQALVALGTERSWVVHGGDGLDEITLAANTFVAEASREGVRKLELKPDDFGFQVGPLENLQAVDAEQSAGSIREILDGRGDPTARKLVVMNAAAAIFLGDAAESLYEAARLAEQSIDSGAARAKLDELIRATNG